MSLVVRSSILLLLLLPATSPADPGTFEWLLADHAWYADLIVVGRLEKLELRAARVHYRDGGRRDPSAPPEPGHMAYHVVVDELLWGAVPAGSRVVLRRPVHPLIAGWPEDYKWSLGERRMFFARDGEIKTSFPIEVENVRMGNRVENLDEVRVAVVSRLRRRSPDYLLRSGDPCVVGVVDTAGCSQNVEASALWIVNASRGEVILPGECADIRCPWTLESGSMILASLERSGDGWEASCNPIVWVVEDSQIVGYGRPYGLATQVLERRPVSILDPRLQELVTVRPSSAGRW